MGVFASDSMASNDAKHYSLRLRSNGSARFSSNILRRYRFGAQSVFACLAFAMLSGCSVHPIPDDIPPRIPTEEIVKSARCEMRLGLFDEVKRLLNDRGITGFDVSVLQTHEGRAAIFGTPPPQLKPILDEYGEVAVAYDFNFDITETDDLNASLAFKLPFTPPPHVFDLGTGGSLHKIRKAKRTFRSQETFLDLILRDQWCGNFEPRDRNLLHPITGSIGLRKVVQTFMALSEQGGGRDNFVDVLTFTTTISGSVNPSVKLNQVPDSFRLVNASVGFSAERTDLHQVTISLAFPAPAKAKKKKNERPQPDDPSGPTITPYAYNPVWRARYNICVADAREREDTFKTLRLSAPEVYCIEYADAFVPRNGDASPPRPNTGAPSQTPDPSAPMRRRSIDPSEPPAVEPPRPRSWW